MIFLVLKFENLKGFALVAIPHELIGEGEQGEVGHRANAASNTLAIVQRPVEEAVSDVQRKSLTIFKNSSGSAFDWFSPSPS